MRAPGTQWEAAMRRALEAAAAAGHGQDVPVGALVLTPDAAVAGLAANSRERDHDPTAHAEILALRQAGRALGHWRLAGCTMVVTLEPCAMCAGALVAARVARIVFGAPDPKAGACGSLWDLPRERASLHHPEVIAGVLQAECAALLTRFFERRRGARADGLAEPREGFLPTDW